MPQQVARPVDHLVLPVGTLAAARARLSALGFTVAPDGHHPFGTVNACVFLADGIYLEPLAVGDPTAIERAIAAGNAFVSRNNTFQNERGEGVSAIVGAAADAQADHAGFVAAGISGGDILEFARAVRLPEGQENEARFRLAFASHEVDPFFLFTCQRINPLPANRQALETHSNGALRLAKVVFHAPEPERYAAWFRAVWHVAGREIPSGLVFDAGNLSMEIVRGDTDDGMLRAIALVFEVADREVTAAVLAASGVAHDITPDGIAVPAAPGQGVAFLFQETSR